MLLTSETLAALRKCANHFTAYNGTAGRFFLGQGNCSSSSSPAPKRPPRFALTRRHIQALLFLAGEAETARLKKPSPSRKNPTINTDETSAVGIVRATQKSSFSNYEFSITFFLGPVETSSAGEFDGYDLELLKGGPGIDKNPSKLRDQLGWRAASRPGGQRERNAHHRHCARDAKRLKQISYGTITVASRSSAASLAMNAWYTR